MRTKLYKSFLLKCISPLELSCSSTLSFLYISGKGLVSQCKNGQQGLAKQKERPVERLRDVKVAGSWRKWYVRWSPTVWRHKLHTQPELGT